MASPQGFEPPITALKRQCPQCFLIFIVVELLDWIESTMLSLKNVPQYSDVYGPIQIICQTVTVSAEAYDALTKEKNVNSESVVSFIEQDTRPLNNRYLIATGNVMSGLNDVVELIKGIQVSHPENFN